MHFFIDHTQLPVQKPEDSFGVLASDPTNKFTITSSFELTTKQKAFACQDGMMIIQQSTVNDNLVNIILKPTQGLSIPFTSVKYYVYRGILKESFILSGFIKTASQTPANSFLERFWKDVESRKSVTKKPNLPDPTPDALGFDDFIENTVSIERVFDNSQLETRPVNVKEGEWIGDFGTLGNIGFEIIVETDNFDIADFDNQIDLGYLRKGNHLIDVTGLTGFNKRAKQELILSYIDPCAFFGLHYENGVNVSVFTATTKTIETKKKADLYSLLEKFATNKRVYLDIRNEKGYSYNFHQNYSDTSGNNLKIGNSSTTPVTQNYSTNGWPLVCVESPLTTESETNDIKLNLRIDDNSKPLLFLENTDLLIGKNTPRFLDEKKILSGTDWSKDLDFIFPNRGTGSNKENFPYYIKIHYFRQEHNSTSPTTVLKNEFYYDSAFAPIDLPNIAALDSHFQHCFNSDIYYTWGTLPYSTSKFSFVGETGVNWDAERILFYNKALFKNERTGRFMDTTKDNADDGFNLIGDFNKMSFLSRQIAIGKNSILELNPTGESTSIKVLDIIKNNSFSNAFEDLVCLGLTQTEFQTLKGISGFTNKYHRYIYLEELVNSPLKDKDDKDFRKYEVKIQGLGDDGNRLIAGASTPIYIYTQNGLVFASKEFAEKEPTTPIQVCGIQYRNDITCVKYKTNYGPLYKGSLKLASYNKWNYLIVNDKITSEEKDILVAMSENEGNMDSIQAYDSEILTVGAMQKTINSLGYGELPIQLWEFKQDYPDKYKKLFEDCGWSIKENNNTFQAYYNNITGSDLKLLIRKGFEEKSYKHRVFCIPIEPFINACKDENYQEKQIIDFIERIGIAINKKPTGYTNKIKDFVKSKLGKATVLDHDVNRPGHVSNCFADALDKFLLANPEVSKNPLNWNENHNIYERKILDIYGPLRGEGDYSMTDATKRYEKLKMKLI